MKLIVGLGNPGKSARGGSAFGGEYDGTRHNIGRDVVRALADAWGLDWKLEKKLFAEIARRENDPTGSKSRQGQRVILALPTTYMNDSGKSVQALVTSYKLQVTSLLIVHDDIDLALGTVRFSHGGSSGGHRGIESIIQHTKTKEFARLRIGVAGKTRSRTDAATYVLKPFSASEKPLVQQIKKRSIAALEDAGTHDLPFLMNRYNKTNPQYCL